MTREEWIKQVSDLGWQFACHEQYDREQRQNLQERLKQLQDREPRE